MSPVSSAQPLVAAVAGVLAFFSAILTEMAMPPIAPPAPMTAMPAGSYAYRNP